MAEIANGNDMGRKLEEALKRAAEDQQERPEFYKMLMDSRVYVVGRTEDEHAGDPTPHLQLKQWKQPDGTMAMPFFATLEAFRDMFGFSEPHIEVSVADLFRFAGKECTLVLHGIEVSKDFKHDEVAMLLNLTVDDPLTLALERALMNREEKFHLPLWNDFYGTLVNSRVFVLGKSRDEGEPAASRMVKDGENLSVATWTNPDIEGPVVPFFSAQKILNLCVPEGESYIAMPALDFFNMAAGFDLPLVLNPGHKFTKLFAAREVKDIVATAAQIPKEQ